MQWARSVTAVLAGSARWGQGLFGLLLAFSLLATSGCAWLDAKQRELIYRPTPGMPADFAGLQPGDERYFVNLPLAPSSPAGEVRAAIDETRAAQQRIELWWLPHPDKDAPTLLYFHGTFRTLFENKPKLDALREAGFSVLALDYRGWGLSTALTPSEQSIKQDAGFAWAELQRREPRATKRVIYGHSMGSGVAVDLASRLQAGVDYGAIILESAFTSFRDIAREAGFLAGLAAYASNERFASDLKIGDVHAPLLMIHGSIDTTIPLVLGKRLFSAANPPKEWHTIEGGSHSDLQDMGKTEYQALLHRFIRQYLAIKPEP
jgi:pimeloyl-ACP methyl ester carboxylesterase